MSHLTVSFDDGLATIVIDRPPQNRIDDQMVDELARAFTAVERSDARGARAQ
jgi:enoyl-CoA hydratase/carnithine racemase